MVLTESSAQQDERSLRDPYSIKIIYKKLAVT